MDCGDRKCFCEVCFNCTGLEITQMKMFWGLLESCGSWNRVIRIRQVWLWTKSCPYFRPEPTLVRWHRITRFKPDVFSKDARILLVNRVGMLATRALGAGEGDSAETLKQHAKSCIDFRPERLWHGISRFKRDLTDARFFDWWREQKIGNRAQNTARRIMDSFFFGGGARKRKKCQC